MEGSWDARNPPYTQKDHNDNSNNTNSYSSDGNNGNNRNNSNRNNRIMVITDSINNTKAFVFRDVGQDKDGNLSYLEFCKNLGSFFRRDPVIMHSLVQCLRRFGGLHRV